MNVDGRTSVLNHDHTDFSEPKFKKFFDFLSY